MLMVGSATDSRPAVDIGLAYRDLDVYGFGTRVDYQRTFANYPQALLQRLLDRLRRVPKTRLDILRDAEGLVESGELLLVLGRPGSGCSTFLKTLAGQTYGFHVDPKARINYQGGCATNDGGKWSSSPSIRA